jgi:lipopolysaccharide export system permease protein
VKTLTFYLIKKYIPPFLGTLFIGVFILFMIFVFTYIDEIAGKGIEAWILTKMFFYIFLRFIPEAMPLAVLLSSIMVFGNLGEQYELAAMKSAGISLTRIMRPLLLFIVGIAGISFVFCNNILPFIQLKGGQLLHDVRDTKPAFKIKEGIFNNSIDGYSIRVGSKDDDGKTIRDVMIYDHTEKRGNVVQVYAEKGKLDISPDKNYLIIELENGNRYQQVRDKPEHDQSRPMMRVGFAKQTVRIDLSGFKMQQTDASLFKGNAEMMNINQLRNKIDTMYVESKNISQHLLNSYKLNFMPNAFRRSVLNFNGNYPCTDAVSEIKKLKKEDRLKVYDIALNYARNNAQFCDSKSTELEEFTKEISSYKVQWHLKFTIAFSCIILFFVGAPLGSIVRKGGLGMPVVISVVLFILFHVLSFSFKKMALENEVNIYLGMWIGPLVFLPIGLFLSFHASRDSTLFDLISYFDFIGSWINKLKKNKKVTS